MKAFGAVVAAVTAPALVQAGEVKEFVSPVISQYQVNNRTLLNDWELYVEYSVDAVNGRDPS